MKGFTLIEVMIAMGVLSIAMLGMVQLAVLDSKNSKGQNLDFDFTIMASNVGMVLHNACTHALAGQTLMVGTPLNLTLNSYPVVSTVLIHKAGVQATSLSYTSRIGPVATSADGTQEFLAKVTLEAKRTFANGTVDLTVPPYSKDFEIDAWADAANQITTCEKAEEPSGSSVTLTGSANVCPLDTVAGTWATTSGVVKSANLVSGTVQIPLTLTSSSGGNFSFTLPGTLGPYSNTYTLFVSGPLGASSWGNTAAQTFTVNIGASPVPCP